MKKDLSKNHPRNRLMDYYIPGASIYCRIVKLEHFSSETPSSSSQSNDLEPFVMYSMNKRKRWEIEAEKLNDSGEENGIRTVVLEREINSCYSTWMCLNNHNFNEAYSCSRVTNPRLLHKAKQSENLISYHIIRVPDHYRKIFDKKCFRYIGLRYPEFLGYSSKDLRPLDYELIEYQKEKENVEEEEEVVEAEDLDYSERPRLFYNLEEHMVNRKSRS